MNTGIRYIISFFYLTQMFLSFAGQPDASWKTMAEQYGNKTAHLHELEIIVNKLNEGTKDRYAVPRFLGISHQEIEHHLQKTAGKDSSTAYEELTALWNDFIQAQPLTQETVTPKAAEALAAIRQLLAKSFETLQLPEQTNKKLLDFISNAQTNNQCIIVRSTGREDSEELANAGGNTSIANVQACNTEVVAAISQVILSYFSEKSLEQRMLAHDPHLHDAPCMPVLIQVMVNEQNVDSIPVAGVMFSQEAEGNTPNVVHINATWGQNDGVVNGLVPVDAFYVGPTGVVHQLIRAKTVRLAPGHVEPIANSDVLCNRPALTSTQVQDLAHAARTIQHHYSTPQDIEFLIQNERIYFVQTRPIVQQQQRPSYVQQNFIAQLPATSQCSICTIGAGGAKTHAITEPHQLIVAPNIRMALEEFLKRNDKDKVHAIIIGELAPAMSHEATTFRGAGKPVVYAKDLQAIQQQLQDLTNNIQPVKALLLDTQREQLLLFVPTPQFPTHMSVICENSWYAHPIAKKVSILSDAPTNFNQMPGSIQPQEQCPGITTTQLLTVIKEGTVYEAKQALASLLARITQCTTRERELRGAKPEHYALNPAIVAKLDTLVWHAMAAAEEISQALDSWEHSAQAEQDRLARLYPVTFLEAMLRQIPDQRQFIDDYSVGSLLKTTYQERQIQDEQQYPATNAALLVQYAKAGQYALTPQLAQEWKSFLKEIPTLDPKLQQQFNLMIAELAKSELLSLWINNTFSAAYHNRFVANDVPTAYSYAQVLQGAYKRVKNAAYQAYKTVERKASKMLHSDVHILTTQFLKDFNHDQSFLRQLHSMQEALRAFPQDPWADPSKFEAHFGRFKTFVENTWLQKDFITHFEQASSLGKMAALASMNLLIELYDHNIKTFSGSNLYKDMQLKKQHFYTMLQLYLQMLTHFSQIPSLASHLPRLLWEHDTSARSIPDYITRIGNLMLQDLQQASDNAEVSFRPSPAFNVAAAVLGSKANFDRSIGQQPTLEDCFTLIHQNLLVFMSVLTQQIGMNKIEMTELISAANACVKSIFTNDRRYDTRYGRRNSNLIGVTYNNATVTYWYNLPMQNHSNTFQVHYNKNNPEEVLIAAQFLGQARNRWNSIAAILTAASQVENISFARSPVVDMERGSLVCSWQIKDQYQADMVARCIQLCSQATMNSGASMTRLVQDIAAVIGSEKFGQFLQGIIQQGKSYIFLERIYLPSRQGDTHIVQLLPNLISTAENTRDVYSLVSNINLISELKYEHLMHIYDSVLQYIQAQPASARELDIEAELVRILCRYTHDRETKVPLLPQHTQKHVQQFIAIASSYITKNINSCALLKMLLILAHPLYTTLQEKPELIDQELLQRFGTVRHAIANQIVYKLIHSEGQRSSRFGVSFFSELEQELWTSDLAVCAAPVFEHAATLPVNELCIFIKENALLCRVYKEQGAQFAPLLGEALMQQPENKDLLKGLVNLPLTACSQPMLEALLEYISHHEAKMLFRGYDLKPLLYALIKEPRSCNQALTLLVNMLEEYYQKEDDIQFFPPLSEVSLELLNQLDATRAILTLDETESYLTALEKIASFRYKESNSLIYPLTSKALFGMLVQYFEDLPHRELYIQKLLQTQFIEKYNINISYKLIQHLIKHGYKEQTRFCIKLYVKQLCNGVKERVWNQNNY